MSTVTFTANIENGKIIIPEMYQQELSNGNTVEVTIVKKKKISETKLLGKLIKNPIQVENFQPLTRDEIYQRTKE
jgi:hypothetical protein